MIPERNKLNHDNNSQIPPRNLTVKTDPSSLGGAHPYTPSPKSKATPSPKSSGRGDRISGAIAWARARKSARAQSKKLKGTFSPSCRRSFAMPPQRCGDSITDDSSSQDTESPIGPPLIQTFSKSPNKEISLAKQQPPASPDFSVKSTGPSSPKDNVTHSNEKMPSADKTGRLSTIAQGLNSDEFQTSSSTSSDNLSVDPKTLSGVGRIIDAMHENKKAVDLSEQQAFVAMSSESTTDESNPPVSAETLEGIGLYIDALTKRDSDTDDQSSCSETDILIPVETREGIEAFIDTLHNKASNVSQSQNNLDPDANSFDKDQDENEQKQDCSVRVTEVHKTSNGNKTSRSCHEFDGKTLSNGITTETVSETKSHLSGIKSSANVEGKGNVSGFSESSGKSLHSTPRTTSLLEECQETNSNFFPDYDENYTSSLANDRISKIEKLIENEIPKTQIRVDATGRNSSSYTDKAAVDVVTTPRTTSLLDEFSDVNTPIFSSESQSLTLSAGDEIISNKPYSLDEHEITRGEKRIFADTVSSPLGCQFTHPLLCSFACDVTRENQNKDLLEDNRTFEAIFEGAQSNDDVLLSPNACQASAENSDATILNNFLKEKPSKELLDSNDYSLEDMPKYFVQGLGNVKGLAENKITCDAVEKGVENAEQDYIEDAVVESRAGPRDLRNGAIVKETKESVVEKGEQNPLENCSPEDTMQVSVSPSLNLLEAPSAHSNTMVTVNCGGKHPESHIAASPEAQRGLAMPPADLTDEVVNSESCSKNALLTGSSVTSDVLMPQGNCLGDDNLESPRGETGLSVELREGFLESSNGKKSPWNIGSDLIDEYSLNSSCSSQEATDKKDAGNVGVSMDDTEKDYGKTTSYLEEHNTLKIRESIFEKIHVKDNFEEFLGEPVENLVDDLMSELYRRASEGSDTYAEDEKGQTSLHVLESNPSLINDNVAKENASKLNKHLNEAGECNDCNYGHEAADSDDALDKAVEQALDEELANSTSFNSTHTVLASPQSPGPVMKIFSDIKSLDEDENITNYLSKLEKDGTADNFFVKFTPPEGASEAEIERLNALVRKLAVERREKTVSNTSCSQRSADDCLLAEEHQQKENTVEDDSSLVLETNQEAKEEDRNEERMSDVKSEDHDELVNAFLMGSTSFTNRPSNSNDLTDIDDRLKNALKLSESDSFVAEEISSTIETKDAGFFSKLAWGASKADLRKLKLFLRVATPIIETAYDEASSPYVAEAQLRREAARAGLSKDFTEEIIGQIVFLNENTVVEASSEDTLELSRKLDGQKFQEIEEVDDSQNISAFLSRMSALQDGGHFGQNRAKDGVSDEAVEIDVNHGFVNKQLEPSESEEVPWWDEDKFNSEDKQQAAETAKATKHREICSASSEEESIIERYMRLPEASERKASEKKASEKKASERNPEPKSTRPPRRYEEWPSTSSRTKVSKGALNASKLQEKKYWVQGRQSVDIGGVSAAKSIARWSLRRYQNRNPVLQRRWTQPYKERIKDHPGFFSVDVFSLYEASAVLGVSSHKFDDDLWEHRDVKQRFLHEKSISMSRNWFGDLLRKRGNDLYKEPVAHPKSMEMPIENLPGEGDWVDEWYTTWQQKKIDAMSRQSDSDSASESNGSFGSETYTDDGEASSRFYDDSVTNDDCSGSAYTDAISDSVYTSRRSDFSQSKNSYGLGEDDSWEEDPPECGTIQNVRLKIGERLSLVHHEHLSSLRRSMWRKKYFPRGTFPYKG